MEDCLYALPAVLHRNMETLLSYQDKQVLISNVNPATLPPHLWGGYML